MAKANLNRLLQIIAVACIVIVFTASALTIYDSQRALTEKDFPLEVDLDRTVFSVGENVTFTASIINRSGRDVNISSNGFQPCAFIRNINDNLPRGETCMLVFGTLKPDEKMSQIQDYNFTEAGTYVLEGYYHFKIGNVEFQDTIANVTIEVR
jgi:hypothetical protein